MAWVTQEIPERRFPTIKALVLDFVRSVGGVVDYDALTAEVKRQFPDSEWKKSHWAWYKNQILHGRFRKDFDESILSAVAGPRSAAGPKQEERESELPMVEGSLMAETEPRAARGPRPMDSDSKRLGDAILAEAREKIRMAAGENDYLRFRINRWVHSRLNLDEREMKKEIRHALFQTAGPRCSLCGAEHPGGKKLELHRINPRQGYVEGNCELLCKACHIRTEGQIPQD